MKWIVLILMCFLMKAHSFAQLVYQYGKTSFSLEKSILNTQISVHIIDEGQLDSLPSNGILFLFSNALPTADELLSSVLKFVENGGRLYVGLENEPMNTFGNELLEKTCRKQAYGNFNSDTLDFVQKDVINQSIPSGYTTVAFPLDFSYRVEAWSNDNPIIVSMNYGNGTIVLDGGYSRFNQDCDFSAFWDFVLALLTKD